MEIIIKIIKVGELIDFINSSEFKNIDFEPISRLRAISFSQNPKADKEDTSLLLAYDKQILIGYLGMFTDKILIGTNTTKFCWLSCMWVLPEYRRCGIALRLLNEGYRINHGYTMITNYIPQSKAAFIKTGSYKELKILEGYRFYLKADLHNILSRKLKHAKYLSWLLHFFDSTVNSILKILQPIYSKKDKQTFTYTFLENIDQETSDFIRENAAKSMFQRSAPEFKWIIDYPWVTDKKDLTVDFSKYYFSQYGMDFKQWFVLIKNSNTSIIGFLMLTRFKNELKTPYFYCIADIKKDIGIFLADFTAKNEIRTIVTYNQAIINALIKKGNYLFRKKSGYGFLASDRLYELLHLQEKTIYDGDGDGAFT